MNRRTFLPRMVVVAVAFVVMAIAFAAGTRDASAQITCCPSYTVKINCSLLTCAFPITVQTCFNGVNFSKTYNVCGTYIEPTSPCWSPPFCGAVVNGAAAIPLGGSGVVKVGCTCALVKVTAVSGCVVITIDPTSLSC